jgi:hypothetical protein
LTHLQLPWSFTKTNDPTFVQSQIRRIDLDSVSSFRGSRGFLVDRSGSLVRYLDDAGSPRIDHSIPAIRQFCFADCDFLKIVHFEMGITLKQIQKAAFRRKSLTRIVVPASVLTLGKSCFAECGKLEVVEFAFGPQLNGICEWASSDTGVNEIRGSIPPEVEVLPPSCFLAACL